MPQGSKFGGPGDPPSPSNPAAGAINDGGASEREGRMSLRAARDLRLAPDAPVQSGRCWKLFTKVEPPSMRRHA
jgi:hypothetical protein